VTGPRIRVTGVQGGEQRTLTFWRGTQRFEGRDQSIPGLVQAGEQRRLTGTGTAREENWGLLSTLFTKGGTGKKTLS